MDFVRLDYPFPVTGREKITIESFKQSVSECRNIKYGALVKKMHIIILIDASIVQQQGWQYRFSQLAWITAAISLAALLIAESNK